MVSQKFPIRRSSLWRQRERFSGMNDKILLEGRLRKVGFQLPAQQQTVLVVEADEALVKGRVVEAGQAQTVLRIQAYV